MPDWGRGAFAAEGSFNRFLFVNLSAVTGAMWTAWVTAPAESAHLRFDWDDVPIVPPCFTVAHLAADRPQPTLSRHETVSPTGGRGRYVDHLTEISVWHARFSGNGVVRPGWAAQLRQMRDMVGYLFESARSAPLLDLSLATAHPFVTAGLIRFGDVREVDVPPDPNPGLVRRRLLVEWKHLESL